MEWQIHHFLIGHWLLLMLTWYLGLSSPSGITLTLKLNVGVNDLKEIFILRKKEKKVDKMKCR